MTRRTWLARLCGVLPFLPGCRPAPVAPPATTIDLGGRFGFVVHNLTPSVAYAIQGLSARHVRWTLYPDTDAADVDTLLAFCRLLRLPPLLVVHGADRPTEWVKRAADVARRNPGCTFQLGNEVDDASSSSGELFVGGHGAVRYASFLADAKVALHEADPTARMATAGLASPKPGNYVLAMLGKRPSLDSLVDAVCVHAYGPPPAVAITERVADVRLVERRVPVWVTEFGLAARDAERAWQLPADQFAERQAAEWRDALEAARVAGVARVYGYAFDGVDGYQMTAPTRQMLAGAQP